MKRGRGTRFAVALISAVLAVGVLPQSASAATVPNGEVVPATITPIAPGKSWVLTSTESGVVPQAHRTAFTQNIAAAEARGVQRVGIAEVLGDLNVAARPLCHATNAAGAEGFCWNDAWGDDSKMEFVPQGLTGSGESRHNQQLVGDRRIVVSSWYSGDPHPTYDKEDLMRVTFADVTDPANVRYRHALLVTPTASGFTNLRGHANSVTWYRNHLYVSTAAGLAVFDLTRIWRTDASAGGVGSSGGTHAAAWHAYALPQVDRYQHLLEAPNDPGWDPDNPRYKPENSPTYSPTNCGSQFGDPPCFAGVSLDDSGAEPALVTTEVGEIPDHEPQTFGTKRSIVRWPLDRTTGLPAAKADHIVRPAGAYQSTVSGAQGVAMHRGRVVVSAACPEFVALETRIASCLYHAWPGEPVRLWTRTGIYAQNVSYWPATDELWTINEAPGDRTVFHTGWPKPEIPLRSLTGTWGDLTGDTVPDLLAVRPDASPSALAGNGNLTLYPGAVNGAGARTSIGTNWNSMRLVSGIGRLDSDTWPDVLAVDDTGVLWLYPGAKGGLGARTQISTGWGSVRAMTGAGDLTGDGQPDLMAVWNDGTAHLYPGKPGGLGTRTQIGTNWNTMRLFSGVGDLTADGRPDVLAVDGAGALWLYPGTQATLGVRTQISTGWGPVRAMTGAGDLTGDGQPDLMAVWNDGSGHLYPGKPGGLGTHSAVDLGWGTP
ncbi:hypothetical protein GCM10010272_49150 [Streptomyces lateritius]|nr:hypothetical protein GCM10010272_49150 [Streptomyces lateritius]